MATPDLDLLYCQFIDCVNHGRLHQLDRFLAADVVEHAPRTTVGIASVQRTLARWLEVFPDLHLVIEDVVVDGDRLMARLQLSGTHRGRLAGAEPTGRRVGVAVFDAWAAPGGRCVERWLQLDMLDLVRQLRA
jgi:predicted ester cyclase